LAKLQMLWCRPRGQITQMRSFDSRLPFRPSHNRISLHIRTPRELLEHLVGPKIRILSHAFGGFAVSLLLLGSVRQVQGLSCNCGRALDSLASGFANLLVDLQCERYVR
jgi:hypothetical protein